MASVTIEGTGTWVSLARGQRKTVTITDERLDRLVGHGFVTVVERHDDAPVSAPVVEESSSSTASTNADSEHVDSDPEWGVQEWRAWFDNQDPPIAYPAEATAEQLAAEWERLEKQRAQPQV